MTQCQATLPMGTTTLVFTHFPFTVAPPSVVLQYVFCKSVKIVYVVFPFLYFSLISCFSIMMCSAIKLLAFPPAWAFVSCSFSLTLLLMILSYPFPTLLASGILFRGSNFLLCIFLYLVLLFLPLLTRVGFIWLLSFWGF